MTVLVNVCGPERSGTTMLDLMLGSGPDAFSLGEISGWFHLYRYRSGHSLPDSWGDIPGLSVSDRRRLLYCSPEDFHRQAFDVLKVSHLIDSSKEKTWILNTQHWAAQHDYPVVNLLLVKDPVDYAHSFWKRGRYAEWERVYRRYYRWMLESGIEFVSISLDDLVQNPASTLTSICAYVGLPYFPGKERFWEFSHHNVKGSPGVQKQVEQGASVIEKRALSPAFHRHIDDVRAAVSEREIGRLLRAVEARSLSRMTGPFPPSSIGHHYTPTFTSQVRNRIHCLAKKHWLRLRHNSVFTEWFYYFNL